MRSRHPGSIVLLSHSCGRLQTVQWSHVGVDVHWFEGNICNIRPGLTNKNELTIPTECEGTNYVVKMSTEVSMLMLCVIIPLCTAS